jgi:hypothetical protein
MKNTNIVLAENQMTAFDPKYGRRYIAITAPTTFKRTGAKACACWECDVKTGGRLCKALPCRGDSERKPVRNDRRNMIWVRRVPEVHK